MRRSLFRALLVACVGSVSGITVTAQSAADWTLEAVLTAALAQHPLVEAARAEVSAAEGARQTATTLPNPIATYWIENAGFPGEGPIGSLEREVSVYGTLPLEPLLQRSSRTARAVSDIRAAEAGVSRAEHGVVLDAARTFYRVALAQASLDASRDNLTAVQQLVDYLRARVSQGASPEGDAIRSEVERDRAATEVTMAEVELLRAQAALRPFLGESAAAIGTVRVGDPASRPARPPLPPFSEFSSRALAQRPELVASRARAEAAKGAIAVERSLVMRQLGATFGVKRTGDTNAMIAGVSLTVPLFDRNRGEIQRATAEQVAADHERRWLERTIAGEVEGAYQAAVRLVAQVAALQPTFLSRAEESRQIALGAYQEGAGTLLQVLDASRALTEARLIYARAAIGADESVFELGIAAGYDARAAAGLTRQGGTR